jgi:magnesium-transporting ATPase (P-type)
MTFNPAEQRVLKGRTLGKERSTRSREPLFRHQELFLRTADASIDEALNSLRSTQEGLTVEDAKERFEQFGANEVTHEKYQWQKQLLKAALNPFIVLLSILAVVSYFTDDAKGAIVMAAMAIISVTLTFIQEFRSSKYLSITSIKNISSAQESGRSVTSVASCFSSAQSVLFLTTQLLDLCGLYLRRTLQLTKVFFNQDGSSRGFCRKL